MTLRPSPSHAAYGLGLTLLLTTACFTANDPVMFPDNASETDSGETTSASDGEPQGDGNGDDGVDDDGSGPLPTDDGDDGDDETGAGVDDSGDTDGDPSAGESSTGDPSAGESSTGDPSEGGSSTGDPSEGGTTGEPDASRVVFLLTGLGAPMSYSGTTGADALCQGAAEDAGLAGEFMAWLSSSVIDQPATRFEITGGPFVLPNGTVVADDWVDLVDGNLDAPILVTADGQVISEFALAETRVVTHTHEDGTRAAAYAPCGGFSGDFLEPETGDAAATDATWSAQSDGIACSNDSGGGPSLYCFEQ